MSVKKQGEENGMDWELSRQEEDEEKKETKEGARKVEEEGVILLQRKYK